MILFEHYGQGEELFCLVVGGFRDCQHQHYFFGAWQIHLHLLL